MKKMRIFSVTIVMILFLGGTGSHSYSQLKAEPTTIPEAIERLKRDSSNVEKLQSALGEIKAERLKRLILQAQGKKTSQLTSQQTDELRAYQKKITKTVQVWELRRTGDDIFILISPNELPEAKPLPVNLKASPDPKQVIKSQKSLLKRILD